MKKENIDADSVLWEWVVDDLTQEEIAERRNTDQPRISEIIVEQRKQYKSLVKGSVSGPDTWEEAFMRKMDRDKHAKVLIRDAEQLKDEIDEREENEC